MKNIIWLLLSGILLISFTGCVTVGKPFPATVVSEIVIGKTTRADIEKPLGSPFRTGIDSGDPTATYLNYKFGLFGSPVTTDLTIVYTPEGVVKSYIYNTNQ
ncbi:hypothetical protein KAR34_06655 [bacterium]|nr:hypothetical protein [bacterium]